MDTYINGGIIKSITIFIKTKEIIDVYDELSKKINLNLFDIKVEDNIMYLDIKDDIINNNFIELLLELKVKHLVLLDSVDENIKVLQKKHGQPLDKAIEYCDDMFKDVFELTDVNTLSSKLYNIEVEYYNIFFDGPYQARNYETIINYLLYLNHEALDNILKDALCFGIN